MFALPPLVSPRFFSQGRRFPLWSLALLSFAGYLILCLWMPLIPHYSRYPTADIRTFSPSLWAGLLYGLLLVGLFMVYGLVYARIRLAERPFPLRLILATTLLFILPLLFTYPINATDIYRYVIRGRISVVHGQNPFDVSPSRLADDPFAIFAGEWTDATTPYGPVWEGTAAALVAISQDNLLLSLLLFKSLTALLHLAVAALLWRLLAHQPPAVRSGWVLLWAWNPALLLMFVVDGHNDVFMLFWLLLGVLLMRRGYPAGGLLVMILAPLTKFAALLPLPFFFLAAWRQLPGWRHRVRLLVITAVGGLALILLAFLPFGSPLALMQRLAYEATSVPGFSAAVIGYYLADLAGMTPSSDLLLGVSAILMVVAGGLGIWLLWRTVNGRSPIRSAADIFALYILQALSFRIWYATWPFPWLLLDEPSPTQVKRLQIGLWFLVTSQLSVLIYGHLRVYALGGSSLLAHFIGVPFTFGLPILLTWRRQFTRRLDSPK